MCRITDLDRLSQKDELIVRSLIRESLLNEYADDYGSTMWTNSPSKGTYGSSLKSIFIDPFVDAFKVGTAETKKLGIRLAGAVSTIVSSVLSVAIPSYQANYSKIIEHQKQSIDKVSKKYEEAYKNVNSSFKHPDIGFFSFMLDPLAWLSLKAISRSPEEVLDSFSMFAKTNTAMQLYLRDIRNGLRGFSSHDSLGGHGGGSNDGQGTQSESVLYEKKETKIEYLKRKLSDPQFQKMVRDSQLTADMKQDAEAILKNTLSDFKNEYAKINAVKNANDIVAITGDKNVLQKLAALSPEEKRKAEEEVVKTFKEASKKFQVTTIKNKIEYLEKLGLNSNNPYISSMRGLISFIK